MAALDEEPAALDAHLAEAEEAGGRCRDVIQKLLYYARRTQEPEEQCDLNQVVRDTVELLGHQLSLDGVQLRTELGDLPIVMAGARELQQVVTALVLNAREAALDPASHSREIRLVTRAFPTSVGLLVADRGPGVKPELRDRIFDPFFTTRPVGRGAGLGLSVSRQILSQFGATLELVETAGPGASFRVDLPLPPSPA
jgi:signal transduction histidine kinase